MEIVYYMIDDQVYPHQYEVAYAIKMCLGTFRSKLTRLGGVKEVDEINFNGFKIKIIKQTITQL